MDWWLFLLVAVYIEAYINPNRDETRGTHLNILEVTLIKKLFAVQKNTSLFKNHQLQVSN